MNKRFNMCNALFFNTVLFVGVSLASTNAFGSACYQYDEGYLVPGDWDGDGVLDAGNADGAEKDYCVQSFDPDNDDFDEDGVGDVCDSCPLVRNPAQNDGDWDGIGDACDDDIDGDLVLNLRNHVLAGSLDTAANMVDTATTIDTGDTATETGADDTSTMTDAGDTATTTDTATDSDSDTGETELDTVGNQLLDNCPEAYNPNQQDADSDGEGDACDLDLDGDGVSIEADFCPFDAAVSSYESDGAHTSVQCLGDSDGDGIFNYQIIGGQIIQHDNCPYLANPMQADLDGDGIGDDCDNDVDGDNVVDSKDNCTYGKLLDGLESELERWHSKKDTSDSNVDTSAEQNQCAIEADYLTEQDIAKPNSKDKAAQIISLWTKEELLGYLQNESQDDLDRDRVGDACDRNFCTAGYPGGNCRVVLDDIDKCLKVGEPQLAVYSPRVIASKTSDEPLRLRIFANRENESLKYTWSRIEGDSDGIKLHNASGIVNCSNEYEYHYPAYPNDGDTSDIIDKSATFETRLEGSYVLRLYVVVLDENGNPKQGDENWSDTYVVVNSSGADDYIADSCGCVAVGQSPHGAWGWLLMALLLTVVLRRRFI